MPVVVYVFMNTLEIFFKKAMAFMYEIIYLLKKKKK